ARLPMRSICSNRRAIPAWSRISVHCCATPRPRFAAAPSRCCRSIMSLLSEIEALLGDDDLGVRREAIYLLYLKAGAARTELLRQFLNHADPRLQTAVVACLAEHHLPEAHDL